MQDEIVKHTKKAFAVMKNSDSSFGHKVQEILLEIGIIVFAVSLSIWLHGWSEHRHQQKEVEDFLVDLKEDVKRDVENITSSKSKTTKDLKGNVFILNLSKARMDSLRRVHGSVELNFTVSQTKLNVGNYEGFKSSGKIGYIENKNLKRIILNYYQVQVPSLVEAEKNAINTSEKLMNFFIDNSEKEYRNLLLNMKFKQYLKLSTDNSKGLITGYTGILKDANELLTEIDKYNK